MPLLETTHHRHGDAPYVPDQSRAERLTSFEPADFGSPTGREEEWRFTPVDRLRALFRDEPTGLCLDWDEHLPEGVSLITRASPAMGPTETHVEQRPASQSAARLASSRRRQASDLAASERFSLILAALPRRSRR